MSANDEIGKASDAFYAALNRMASGQAGSMEGVWSHGSAVTTMHPIGGREVGWEAVSKSFEQVAQLATGGSVELKDRLIQVVGDAAYEAGVEVGQIELAGENVRIEHRVTNVYRREAGAWKMVHHHTDISQAMLDVLKRL